MSATLLALEAQRTACVAVLSAFRPEGATVAQMQSYANCVIVLHGSGAPLSHEAALALKALIVMAVLGAGGGAVIGWRDDVLGPWPGVVLGTILGLLTLPALGVLVGALGAGVVWVLS